MIKTICLKWNIEVKKLNMFICKILSEILVNQQVMGPSGMEMDLSEIQIAHPTLGTNFRSLQCSWSQWDTTESQFEVFFLHCSDMYILLEPFQVDSHEGSSRKCQLKNMAGYQRPLLQHHQEYRTSWVASSSLRGTRRKRNLLQVLTSFCPHLEPLITWWWWMHDWLFFGSALKERAHHPSMLGKGTLEGEVGDLSALWAPAAMRSTRQQRKEKRN